LNFSWFFEKAVEEQGETPMILFLILSAILTMIAAYGATPSEKRRLFPDYD
jgi:hypothetical protein